jgi:transaldolase
MKTFCDSASVEDIQRFVKDSTITGFTTNPTLMKKAGIADYLNFAREAVSASDNKPISFEVFSQDPQEMKRQAKLLASLGSNVYVKITPLNYDGSSLLEVIRDLSCDGVQLNVTAVFTLEQVRDIINALDPKVMSIVSVFAGRIADAGVDPEPIIHDTKILCAERSDRWEVLWASPREAFNLIQAERSGADIITATPDLLVKRKSFGKDLTLFSLETARMFMDDAKSAGYSL